MLFLIMGAGGSGKSSALAGLKACHPEIDWRDFDHAPQLATTTAERQLITEYWLQLALENQSKGVHTGIAGGTIFGEVLACTSAAGIDRMHALLLDCGDVVRIDRIRARDGAEASMASQDMLSWAAWQRMHASDPEWRPDVIQAQGAPGMRWERWSGWRRGDARWQVDVLDNSALSREETTAALAAWVDGLLARSSKALPAG